MEHIFSEVYKRIGNSIKEKRKEKGLTQQQLADRVPKLDRSKVSDMENGKEDFMLSTLLKICEALEVDIEILLHTKNINNA